MLVRLALPVGLLLGVAADAQQPTQVGRSTLRGVVKSEGTGRVIANAVVDVRGVGRSARTDSLGAFVLRDLPAGNHAVEVRALGFMPLVRQLSFGADTLERQWLLTPQAAQRLERVEVTARPLLLEFEERRLLGKGRFIGPEELERQRDRRLGEVLSRVPGLRIERGPTGSDAYARNSRGTITMLGSNPGCYVHVYVDDVLVSHDLAADFKPQNRIDVPFGLFNLNSLPTVDLYGVEYYAGGASIPTKYNRTGSACGVLLLWTRR